MLLKQMHLEPAKYTGAGRASPLSWAAAAPLAAPGGAANNNNWRRQLQFTAAGAGRQAEPIWAGATTTFANAHYSAASGSHYTFGSAAFCFGDLSGAKRFPTLEEAGSPEPPPSPSHQRQQQQQQVEQPATAISATSAAAAAANHNNGAAAPSKRDRMKLMELSIINLVELSAQAAGQRKVELALERAREAADALGGLKVALAQAEQQQLGAHANQAPAGRPMTTAASLFELALMVNSNLAGQLKNAGRLEEAVELYTQLCKQAAGTAGGQLLANSSAFLLAGVQMSSGSSASSGQQHELRFLLYRFGMNIGNALFELGEFQRALKYYRLTLDRLSSSGGLRNLKIKLMNNISLALLAQQEQQRQQQQQRQQPAGAADAITSLNLLLADNLSQPTNEQGASGGTAAAAGGQTTAPATTPTASSSTQVCNSNHHRFGLNLLVCHHKRADLAAMMGTLKALVRVDICHQYRRVFDWPPAALAAAGGGELDVSAAAGAPSGRSAGSRPRAERPGRPAELDARTWAQQQRQTAASNATSGAAGAAMTQSATNEGRAAAAAAHAPEQQQRRRTGGDNGRPPVGGDARTTLISGQSMRPPLLPAEAAAGAEGAGAGGFLGARQPAVAGGAGDYDGEHLSASRAGLIGAAGDELGGAGHDARHDKHRADGGRTRNQQFVASDSSAPLTSNKWSSQPAPTTAEKCRQVMSCIQEDRLEILIGEKHGQIARSLIMASNLLLELDNRTRLRRPGRRGGSLAPAAEATSAFDFCLKLMAASDSYKALICDLKTNNVSSMLADRGQLDAAIAVLKEIDSERWQPPDSAEQQPRSSNSTQRQQQPNPRAHLLLSKAAAAAAAATNLAAAAAGLAATAEGTNTLARSSMVATNSSLLRLLQRDTRRALSFAEHAIRMDKANVASWINLANCHFQLGDFQQAQLCYQKALALDPRKWDTNYNLALLNRKLGRQFGELKPSTIRASLARDRQCLSATLNKKMVLSVIQLAFIYQQSAGKHKQALAILQELITNSKCSPEVYLTASKLLDSINEQSSQLSSSSSSSSSSAAAAAAHQYQHHDKANSNNVAPAVALLQQANREHPYYLPVLERLIALNIRNFNYQAAQGLLVNCIKIRPDQVKWFRMLAECHRRAANYSGAMAIYKQAIDLFPQDTSCLKALIKLTDELGLNSDKQTYEIKLEKLTSLSEQSATNINDIDIDS